MRKIFLILLTVFSPLVFIVLQGCDDAGNLTNNPNYKTVNGLVVDDNGNPVQGCLVAYQGDALQTITTGADGGFYFKNVTTPYDIYLIKDKSAVVYRGVVSINPLINTFYEASSFKNQTQINVSFPFLSINQVFETWFESDNGQFGSDTLIQSGQSGSIFVSWTGNTTLSGYIMGLVYTVDNNMKPVMFNNYGKKYINFANGFPIQVNFTTQDLSITPGTALVGCTVPLPNWSSGYPLCSLYISTSSFYNYKVKGFHLYGMDQASQYVSYYVPVYDTEFNYYMNAYCNQNESSSNKVYKLQLGVNTVSIEDPPVLNSPANNFNSVNYQTDFSYYCDMYDGIYRINFVSDSLSYDLNVITTNVGEPGITIPNLNFLNFTPDLSKNYTWQVIKYSNMNSITDFTSYNINQSPVIKSVVTSYKWNFKFSPNP